MNRRQILAALPLLAAWPLAARSEEAGAPVPAVHLMKPADKRLLTGLQVIDESGKALKLQDHSGQILIINLWAPWCVPCRREMPSLSRLQTQLDGLSAALLPVAFVPRRTDGVRRFFEETGISNLPVLAGDGENLLAVTGKSHLPLTLIADKEGRWAGMVEGEASWDDAETLRWITGLAAA